MENNVKYFEVKDSRDYHIGRWLKKPSSKRGEEARKIIAGRGIKIVIGVSVNFVDIIVKSFNKLKISNVGYDIKRDDLIKMSVHYEISISLIKVILEGEGLLK